MPKKRKYNIVRANSTYKLNKSYPNPKYMKKWVKADGSPLTVSEYKSLIAQVYSKGLNMEEFFAEQGIVKRYSSGALQDPLTNHAQLTLWHNKEGLFLTKWAYKEYFEQARLLGKSVEELLKLEGFSSLKEENANLPTLDRYTTWISPEGEILVRRDYKRFMAYAKKEGISTDQYLLERGYKKLLEPKVDGKGKKSNR